MEAIEQIFEKYGLGWKREVKEDFYTRMEALIQERIKNKNEDEFNFYAIEKTVEIALNFLFQGGSKYLVIKNKEVFLRENERIETLSKIPEYWFRKIEMSFNVGSKGMVILGPTHHIRFYRLKELRNKEGMEQIFETIKQNIGQESVVKCIFDKEYEVKMYKNKIDKIITRIGTEVENGRCVGLLKKELKEFMIANIRETISKKKKRR